MMKLALAFALATTLPFASCTTAFADGDAVEGKDVFKKCRTCHEAAEEVNRVGPHLVGVVGRTAGSLESYQSKYSSNIKELGQGGLIWTEEILAAYLRKPKDIVPKGKMAFAGLKKDEDIANVIEYLKADPKP